MPFGLDNAQGAYPEALLSLFALPVTQYLCSCSDGVHAQLDLRAALPIWPRHCRGLGMKTSSPVRHNGLEKDPHSVPR